MTKLRNWLINNCGCICKALHIINSISNGNDKYNDSYVILMKGSNQLPSNYFIQATLIEFMQIYIEPHLYFGVLHDIHGIKHIVNLLASCRILKRTFYIDSPITSSINSILNFFILQNKHYHLKQTILRLNTLSLSAEYHISNYIKLVLNEIDVLLSLVKTSNCHNQIFDVMSQLNIGCIHMNHDNTKLLFSYHYVTR